MARVTKKAVLEAIDEWAELQARKRTIEAARDEQLVPIRKRFDKAATPIVEAANEELLPVCERQAEIEKLASEYLLSGLSDDGSVALRKLSGVQAHAEVLTQAQREIEPSKFFTQITDRTDRFWKCVKVLVGNAEKAFGDKINDFATLKVHHRVVVKLNDEAKSD